MKDTPIYITTRDRGSFLKKMIDRLKQAGTTNIIVIDTGSTYPPILEYYDTLSYPIERLGNITSLPQLALWNYGLLAKYHHENDWFVLSDCDILPSEECPDNYLEYFKELLIRHPDKDKCGFGLRIDDIPDCYQHKHVLPGKDPAHHPGVMEWEPGFWRTELEPGVYDAPIDTTFALYRPGMGHKTWQASIRTGFPYTARHLAWYCNSISPDEEELYYKLHIGAIGGNRVDSWEL